MKRRCVGFWCEDYAGEACFDGEMRDTALHALQNEGLVLGESVFRFEEEFARYCGVKYAVSTGSGTSALQLSLLSVYGDSKFGCTISGM